MAWERVLCSCGHYSDIQVLGKAAEREKKIQYFKDAGLCKDCYKQYLENQKALGCEVIKMDYRSQYKAIFGWCDKVVDSYDKSTKTIKVYVPNDVAEFAKAVVANNKIAQFEAMAEMLKNDAKHLQKFAEYIKEDYISECREYLKEHHAELFEGK